MDRMLDTLPEAEAPVVAGNERMIGGILLEAGRITPAALDRVLRLQQKEKGLLFGEACVRLGLISQADVAQALAGQFRYPYLRRGQGALGRELAAAYEPFSAQVEALRALRAQLLLRWFCPERRVLTIASPSGQDGRSYIAANLAVVFAQLGWETLLVDADLRRPRQHTIFNLGNRLGLSGMLAGRASADGAERIAAFSHLSVLAAGAAPPNPLELLSRLEFPRFLHHLARRYAVVLIDSPAADSGADALTVAVRAGGALLVAREGHTRLRDLQMLAAGIVGAGGAVVGTVLNRPH